MTAMCAPLLVTTTRGGLRYRTRVSATAGADGRATMAVPGSGVRHTLTEMPLAVEEAEDALLAATTEPGQLIEVATTSLWARPTCPPARATPSS